MWIVYTVTSLFPVAWSSNMKQRHEAGLICNFLSLGLGSPLAWWRGERERERDRERVCLYFCDLQIFRMYIYIYTPVYITFAVCLSLALPHPVEASGPSNNAAANACTFSLASGLYTSTFSIFVLFLVSLSLFVVFMVCGGGCWSWLLAPSGFPCSLFLQRQWGNAGVLACSPLSASKLNNYKRKMLALSYCIELWAN